MRIVVTVSAVLLAICAAAAGLTALLISRDRLAALPATQWLRVVSPDALKVIGVTALVAGTAILIPTLAGTADPVVPLAGLIVAWLLTGTIVMSILHDQFRVTAVAAILMVISAVLVWGWLTLHP